MTEETKAPEAEERTIVEELSELGRQLGAAFKAAWESEERRKLQQEIREGLAALGDQLEEAVQTARESEALQELRADLQKAVETARQSEPAQDIGEGLLKGLRQINRQLSRLLASWEKPAAGPEAPEEGASTPDA